MSLSAMSEVFIIGNFWDGNGRCLRWLGVVSGQGYLTDTYRHYARHYVLYVHINRDLPRYKMNLQVKYEVVTK